jgi:hypothetical protein
MRGLAGNERRLVAVGRADLDGMMGAAAWSSPDGRKWRLSPEPDLGTEGGTSEQVMSAVVWARGTFLAGGFRKPTTDKDAALWTSADGREWELLSLNAEVFGGLGEQEIWGVSKTQDGWVAVGSHDDGQGEDAAVWLSTSPSLDRWSRLRPDEAALGGDGDQEMRWVVEFEGRLVGVGWSLHGDARTAEYDAEIWYAELKA